MYFFYVFRVSVYNTVSLPYELNAFGQTCRGIHALTMYSWSESKCIVCKLCEFVCPAQAILIHSSSDVRRAHLKYDIDLVKCIYCNYCGIVCPVYAIKETVVVDAVYCNLSDHYVSDTELVVNALVCC